MMDTATAKGLRAIRQDLSATFYERNDVITAMLVAVLAGEHLFMLGPPGTGKSQLCRAMTRRFVGAHYYETLLSRTRMPEDVHGPLDLLKLQSTGAYVRLIDGFLPSAHLVFLDEIGKMGPVLGHSMLAALNERVRHEVNEHGSVHPIPLSTAFTASNEIPVNESEDAAALYDRLLVRVVVDYIGGKAAMAALLSGRPVTGDTATVVPWDEVHTAITTDVPQVEIPDAVVDAVLGIRDQLRTAKIVVSDRRWRRSMKAMQAHAYLEGRPVVTLADLRVLEWTLWSTPDQIPTVHRAWQDVADPLSKDVTRLVDEISAISAGMRSRRGESQGKRAGYGLEAGTKLKALERELHALTLQYVEALGSVQAANNATEQVVALLTSTRTEVQQLSLVED
jgi:MoxR-like ATPase